MKKKTKMMLFIIIGYCLYFSLSILNTMLEVNTFQRICLTTLRYGGMLGALFGLNYFGTKYTWERNPEVSKDELVNLSDERLVSIRTNAKAKAFDIMVYTLILLGVVYADLRVGFLVLSLLIAAGIIMTGCYFYYKNKYTKEM